MIPRHKSSALEATQWKLSQILVPIDFSERSEKALHYAVGFADQFGARIVLLHVVQPIPDVYDLGATVETSKRLDDEFRQHAERSLKEMAAKVANAVPVTCEVRSGNAVEEIVESAERHGADLIVTGTHGRTGLKHVFLGSVAEGTIRYAPCPVLVVRSRGTDAAGATKEKRLKLNVKKILTAVDFSETSDFALGYAERIARTTGAPLVLAHVAPIHYPISEYGALECPQVDADLLEASQRNTRELAESELQKDIKTEFEVRQGSAGVEIVEAAEKCSADLIVIGTRGLTGLRHVLLGSTAEYVVRHAPCPVLTVRQITAGPRDRVQKTRSEETHMEVLQTVSRTHPLLREMDPRDVRILLKDAVVAEFDAGEILFRQGDYADKFFLIHEGRVAVEYHSSGRDVVIQTVGPGEVLGWSWLFPPFSWHFQARAVERTVAVQVNGAQALIASESDDRFGHQLMKRFAQVLIHRLLETQKRLVERTDNVEVGLGDTL